MPGQDIMTKTLPQIIDELEDAIAASREATIKADKAAAEAKKAAAEARAEGQRAAGAAQQAAESAVEAVRNELKADVAILEGKCVTEAQAVNAALVISPNTHFEQSPFLKE